MTVKGTGTLSIRTVVDGIEYKPCSKCKGVKLLTDFYKANGKTGGYKPECKLCTYEMQQKTYGYKEYASIIDLPDEEWREVEGFDGRYFVSNKQRVKSIARFVKHEKPSHTNSSRKGDCLLTPSIRQGGYKKVRLSVGSIGKGYFLHRIIAKAFISNPDNKPCINHIDCNPSNNSIENLEWCTNTENIAHAKKMGRMKGKKGEENNMAILNDDYIRSIRALRAPPEEKRPSAKDVGIYYGVGKTIILNIEKRKAWAHVV